MRSNIIDVEVVFVHATDKAYLVKPDEDSDGVWLPASLVDIDGPLTRDSIATVMLPESIATEKGLV